MADRSLRFLLLGEDKSASKTFDKVGKKSDGLGKKLGGLGKMAALGAAGAGAAIGAGLVTLGPKVFGLAAQMETLDAKAKTVFGPQALKTVQGWAKSNANAMGLTGKEAVGLAAGFADLLIPMGFTRDQAAKMSTETVGLSGALSQWTGGTKSAAEVSDILSAAMLGETDGLKSLGIAISAADIDARLLKNGTDKLKGAQLQQARATATQQLIFEKSTDAQTAFKNSGGTLIGQQQKLTAQMKELRDKAVARLVPLILRGANAVSGLAKGFREGTGAGGKLREGVTALRERFEKYRPVIQTVAEALAKVGFAIVTTIVPAFFKLQGVVYQVISAIIPPVLTFFSTLIGAAAKAFGWVPGLGPKLKTAAREFEQFKDTVNGQLAAIRDQEIKLKVVADIDKRIGNGDLSVSEGGAAGVLARGGGRPITPPKAAPKTPTNRQPLAADRSTGDVYLDGQKVGKVVRSNLNASQARGTKLGFQT